MISAKIAYRLVQRILLGASAGTAVAAQGAPVHAMWVWKSPTVLAQPNAAQNLMAFCRANGINEIYISVYGTMDATGQVRLDQLIGILHNGSVRVDALFSSTDADEGGAHLQKLLGEVQAIETFNQKHPQQKFDGIHLDIEPQQRPENKGSGNLAFLPGLVNAYTQVKQLSAKDGLPVNADIQTKLLKGSADQRKMLLTALPAMTLMLYELSSPTDGQSTDAKESKLRSESQKYLQMAEEGLDAAQLARIAIGLRTPDYRDLLPLMPQVLDQANGADPIYAGRARHSYNDVLPTAGSASPN
ncbi:MAG: hypothetical protein ACLPZY_09925 [Terracidiphilus sp.]